jgi:predicted SAM-dependent methyltransferase
MHATSLENMEYFVTKWISTLTMQSTKLRVLDVGGADYNGSYRSLFSENLFNFTACDLTDFGNVDVVMTSEYELPFNDEEFDLVISGQTFEHCPKFWELFLEMKRVCKQSGLIIVIAPSAGGEHKFPTDCYRFLPGAFEFLAHENKIELIDLFCDTREPWKDLIGVFAKTNQHQANFKSGNQFMIRNLTTEYEKENFGLKGTREYMEVLTKIHQIVKPKNYLEIGVQNGKSLQISKCKSVAIDPFPNFKITNPLHELFEMTSDQYFRSQQTQNGMPTPDLVFIDGMHLFEYVYRDFMNVESVSDANTVVVIDDIFPITQLQGSRERVTKYWMGDVWHFWSRLRYLRPDLTFIELNTKPSGLGIVLNLNPNSRILGDSYNQEVRTMLKFEGSIPDNVINRENAINPSDKNLNDIFNGTSYYKTRNTGKLPEAEQRKEMIKKADELIKQIAELKSGRIKLPNLLSWQKFLRNKKNRYVIKRKDK